MMFKNLGNVMKNERKEWSTHQLYDFKHINKGFFINKNDVPVIVLEIKAGVNLLNKEEDVINEFIQSYAKVFESLKENDVMQLITTSRPLNAAEVIKGYTEKQELSDVIANKLIIGSQNKWVSGLARQSWSREISYYVLISTAKKLSSIQVMLENLRQRSLYIIGFFNKCGLEVEMLDKNGIKDLFDRECNPLMDRLPDEAVDLAANVDIKGKGYSSQKDAIARDAIVPKKDHLEFGSGAYSRTFYCETLPFNNWEIENHREVFKANIFFHNVFIHCGYFRFSLYAYGQNQEKAKVIIQKQHKQFLQVQDASSEYDEDSKVALARYKLALQRSAEGRLFYNRFSFYITLYSRSLEELDDKSVSFQSLFNEFHLKSGVYEQDKHYASSLPFCREFKDISNDMPSDGLANAFSFMSARVGMNNGVLIGFDQFGEPVYFDPWAREEVENAITVKIGQPGSGKSFSEEIEGLLLYPENIVSCIFHKSTSYDFSNKLMGGQSINFGVDSETKINIFDPADPDELKSGPSVETVLTILGALEIMLFDNEKMNQLDRSMLEDAIRKTYERMKGKVPLLEDLAAALDDLADHQEMKEHKLMLKNLKMKLKPFIDKGIYAELTNRPSSVNINANRIVVNLSGIPENDAMLFNLAMYMCSKIAYKVRYIAQQRGIKKALIKFDETWAFVSSEYGRKMLSNLSRRSRHLNVAVYLSTQYASDCNVNEEAKAFLRGAQSIFILKQPAQDREILKEVFRFGERELDIIAGIDQVKGVYSQCYAITGKRRGLIHIMANPHLYWAATSEPIKDIPLRNKVLKNNTNSEGNIDYVAAINELVNIS